MSPPKKTPMISQYLHIKEQYPDAILFYRMGDFYEMFFEDAEKASKLLEITLTSRNKKEETQIPMCGVPYKAAQGYISKLINKGYKVAICDQVEDPATAKGLVKREVVRVVTPGMIVEDELLKEKSNNYILSVTFVSDTIGFSVLDISTGTFRVTESKDLNQVLDEALRISPSEVLLPETDKKDHFFSQLISAFSDKALTYIDQKEFHPKQARERLIQQFNTLSLEGFGCEHMNAGVGAAGALISYVHETQKQNIEHITALEAYRLDSYLWVDNMSFRNLEIFHNLQNHSRKGSLLGVIDKTITSMGARLLKTWVRYPHIDSEKITERLDAVEEGKEKAYERKEIRESLKSVYDLERLGTKIAMSHSNARDLTALKRSLQKIPDILNLLSDFKSNLFLFNEKHEHLQDLADLIDRAIREDAPPTISEGDIIKEGFDPELDELVKISRDGKGWLAKLEAREKEDSGITALKVRYNKVFGYYIEIPKSRAENAPEHYIRKQTLVNAERYITDELKSFEARVLDSEDRRNSLEYQIFNQIREEVLKSHKSIQAVARFIAQLDCLLNFSEISDLNDYCRPEINDQGFIHMEDGRHPVVEKLITGERFVPNTLRIDNETNQISVITGPNMAGKSTILRQIALLVIMTQIGSFVPARKASVCMTDRIFTRVGALDNLSQGQSTFMVEMQETANILNNSTPNSLVIMDEIGRGTSTFDGLSIAWAVAEHLHDLHGTGVKTLFATHYHELTELARTKKRARNFNIAVKEWNDEIIFLRKLVQGGTGRSYGIQVARLAGIPKDVIIRAKKILTNIENNEYQANGAPSRVPVEGVQENRHKQLSLFRGSEDLVIEHLRKIDISSMTPIEALNCLDELKKQV